MAMHLSENLTLVIDHMPRIVALSSLGKAVIYSITHWMSLQIQTV